MNVTSSSTVIVVPTYNERDNVPTLIGRVLRETPYALLIVDDASPDGTGDVVEQLARTARGRVSVLHRQGPRGLGKAYIDGMRQALASGAERIVQMDADLSHGPEFLHELVAATSSADVAIGSRYIRGVSVAYWPLRRLLLSLGANAYVRWVTGLRVRDATSGFKCWRRDALAAVLANDLRSEGYALQFEMLFYARKAGFTLTEVPIIFVERREGASKMSRRVMWEAAMRPLELLLRPSPNKTKVYQFPPPARATAPQASAPPQESHTHRASR